jgi:hypothetical protein
MPSAARPLRGRLRVVTSAVSSAPSTANSPGRSRPPRRAVGPHRVRPAPIEETCTNLQARPARRRRPSARRQPGRRSPCGRRRCPPRRRPRIPPRRPGQQLWTSPAEAASRSHAAASAPALCTSAAWAGFLISPAAWSPRSAGRRSSRSAIFPCPPAITMRAPPAYLPGSPADATTPPAGRAPTGKGILTTERLSAEQARRAI